MRSSDWMFLVDPEHQLQAAGRSRGPSSRLLWPFLILLPSLSTLYSRSPCQGRGREAQRHGDPSCNVGRASHETFSKLRSTSGDYFCLRCQFVLHLSTSLPALSPGGELHLFFFSFLCLPIPGPRLGGPRSPKTRARHQMKPSMPPKTQRIQAKLILRHSARRLPPPSPSTPAEHPPPHPPIHVILIRFF